MIHPGLRLVLLLWICSPSLYTTLFSALVCFCSTGLVSTHYLHIPRLHSWPPDRIIISSNSTYFRSGCWLSFRPIFSTSMSVVSGHCQQENFIFRLHLLALPHYLSCPGSSMIPWSVVTMLFTPPSRLGILTPQAVQKLGHMLPFNFYYYYLTFIITIDGNGYVKE